MIILYTVSVHR